MNTGRWSELSAEHVVRYTGKRSSLVITISKTSGIAEELCGLVVGVSGPKIRQDRHNHVSVSPSRLQPRVPVYVFCVEVAVYQVREYPA